MTDAERQADERAFNDVIKEFPDLTELQVEALRRFVLGRLEQQRMLAELEDPELVALRKIEAICDQMLIDEGLDPDALEDVPDDVPHMTEAQQQEFDRNLDEAVRRLTPGAH